MNRQGYKKAAESLLERAEKCIDSGFSPIVAERVESLTGIARVYAMLAAIPDTLLPDSTAQEGGFGH